LFVDGTQMKRQNRPSSATVLKPPNALAQLGQSEVALGMQHA